VGPLDSFHAPVRAWFRGAFAEPTAAQVQGWPPIRDGRNTLLLAPTGSGKTLAAFLTALDRLMFAPAAEPGCRVLYVSPLKALGVDVERNLRAPIAGIRAVAERDGAESRVPRVAIRTGDTPPAERQRMGRKPPDILITTPESLYLMLTSNVRSILRTVETVIVDEIHSLVATKRGAHLFTSLERLEELRTADAQLQRIGLSATQRPLDEIGRLLAGGKIHNDHWTPRPVEIVDAGRKRAFELRIEVPVEDMADLASAAGTVDASHSGAPGGVARVHAPLDEDPPTDTDPELFGSSNDEFPPSGPAAAGGSGGERRSIWPSIHPRLVELVRAHRSTMIFVNSRRLAERLAGALNEEAGEELALAHHGSLSKDTRAGIEDRLKRGQLPAIVATSSLELGIDMGAVDLVIQVEAPPSVASGMQRVGRAGHRAHAVSRGIVFPKYRGDLLACAAVAERMNEALVEETHYLRNPLDVLAQQLVAMAADGARDVDASFDVVRRAAPFSELPRSAFDGVLDMLSGRYPSDDFADLKPRITWDRIAGTIEARKGAKRIAIVNGGTIPDRGLYGVFLAHGGDGRGSRRVGELDEEMVFESRAGDVFLLGASSWRIEDITHDRVLVTPAPGEPGKMPFWHGDRPGRPLELGRAIGELARALEGDSSDASRTRLVERSGLDERAADNLLAYIADQREATKRVPSDRTLILERFTDEIGDWRVCLLSPFGARVHAPWAISVARRLRDESNVEVDFVWSDDGIVFRLPEAEEAPSADAFLPASDEVERLVVSELASTSLFAARFRENAGRSLLLPKKNPARRAPLWAQRRRSANLLQVASRFDSFPIVLETYRECLKDTFDLPGMQSVLRDIENRRVRVEIVDSRIPSPFSASLLFSYVANFIYDGDAPLAERRAQILSIDHARLREILGEAELRELLDADVILERELSLRGLKTEQQIHHPDDLHDRLLQLGDLSRAEIRERSSDPGGVDVWVDSLVDARRVVEVAIAAEPRIVPVEHAAGYRDGLGVVLPGGLPESLLEERSDPLDQIVARYARTHGPFRADAIAQRYGLASTAVRAALERLEARERVVEGEFLPRGTTTEWCDVGVLASLKRLSLAKLRREVEPVEPARLGRFLPAWHGVDRPGRGLDALLGAVEQLQGAPIPASVLEAEILPARVDDYRLRDLDELTTAGEIIWRGVDPLGATDGRIALYTSEHYPRLAPPAVPAEGELTARLRDLLGSRGALFFSDLVGSTGAFPGDVLEALWSLVWAGEVSNDSLAPLRSRSGGEARGGRARGAGRSARRGGRTRRLGPPGSEGRWSLLPGVAEPNSTDRKTALAQQLLERSGVLTREAVHAEGVEGGFSAIYPVLKAMEEAGKIRRGYFVAGLGAAQFALPGADDRLRRESEAPRDAEALALAATDPANPYGAALKWPEHDGGQPQRVAGAIVVLWRGQLIGYVGRTEESVLTFLPRQEPERGHAAKALASALADRVQRAGRRALLVSRIDGAAPSDSPLSPYLEDAGFGASSRGFLKRKSTTA